jgi:hypothetical protein
MPGGQGVRDFAQGFVWLSMGGAAYLRDDQPMKPRIFLPWFIALFPILMPALVRGADVLTPCFLKLSIYTNIPGTAVADLMFDPSYPDAPSEVRYIRALNTRDALPTDELQDYGGRIEGFITPLESGDYHFFLRSDKASMLWLSSDETEESAVPIAEETDSGDPFMEFETGDFATSAAIPLVEGERYFIMVLYKASSGGGNSTDFAQVAWRRVEDTTPAIELKPISGAYLSTMASDEAGPTISILQQPMDLTAPENSEVIFTVEAAVSPEGPVCIQWQRNGENISGATGTHYTRFLDEADNGARFRAVISTPGAFENSAEATVTVTEDTTAPSLVGARGGPNRPEVLLSFSERLDPDAAETAANYTLTAAGGMTLAVNAAELRADGTQVILLTDPQEIGTEYTVTVANVTDLAVPSPNVIGSNNSTNFFALGPWLQGDDGFVIWEAEDYDRNLDGLWFADAERGTPSGGLAMVNFNGAGGSEATTKLEYDIVFTKTGTHTLWYRNSGNDGNDDSVFLHLDGARPPEREQGNLAVMSGFTSGLQGAFGWASSAFEGGGQMTFNIDTPGVHSIGIARREDGAYLDKFIITTDPNFNPNTGFGPFGPSPTRRQGEPTPPDVVDFEITTQPMDIAAAENTAISLTVEAEIPEGTIFLYQWQRREGAEFVDLPNETLPTLTIDPLTLDWNGAVVRAKVTVAGVTKFSDEATITVTVEQTPPEVTRVTAVASSQTVVISLSEPVTAATAEVIGNYEISSLSGPLPVTSAMLLGGRVIVLGTGAQTAGTKYLLTINGVADTAATPNVMMDAQARFYSLGERLPQTDEGLLVVEAESFDRNLDELWSIDRMRGTPSGGASVVNYNGAGGSETATKVEYDLEFTQTGTHIIWYRASSDGGNDDSVWLHVDGDRPPERAGGNQASMSGFNGAQDFIWESDAQEGSDPMTFEIMTPGIHSIALARREDGAFIDKLVITIDPEFDPEDYGPWGPPETREGAPPLPTIEITSPAADQEFGPGEAIPITAEVGTTARTISLVEFFGGGEKLGEATQSPYTFNWENAPAGTNVITARVVDDVFDSVRSRPVTIVVGGATGLIVTASPGPGGLTLTWAGGAPPYTVQRKTLLTDPEWADVLTTQDPTATVAIEGQSGFFRVGSQ